MNGIIAIIIDISVTILCIALLLTIISLLVFSQTSNESIPPAALSLGHDTTATNCINEATGQEGSLIEMARKSLDEKNKLSGDTDTKDFIV